YSIIWTSAANMEIEMQTDELMPMQFESMPMQVEPMQFEPMQNDTPMQVDASMQDDPTAAVAPPNESVPPAPPIPAYTYIATVEPPFPLTNDALATRTHQAPMVIELTKLPLACLQLVTPEEACVIQFNDQKRVPTRMTTISLLSRLSYIIAN